MNKIDAMVRELGSANWAISKRAFDSLLVAISNENLIEESIAHDFNSLNSSINNVDGTWYAKKINNVGILEILGPIIPYKTWYEGWLGFVSVERLIEDLEVLQKDVSVKDIIITFDTPGGMVDGVSSFANVIAESEKPITAHILGDAASAGYWLASQAKEITSIDTGRSGSIGVVTTIVDFKDAYEKRGIKKFDVVNSQSPRKRTDLTTEEGRTELQAILNSIADVFIDSISRGRNIDREKVLNDFGQGAEFAAFDSLERGLIDRIINTNDLLKSFNNDIFAQREKEPLVVQSLIFSKKSFTREQAVSWAKNHGFHSNKVDETSTSYRLRQREPSEFKDFVTKELTDGVMAVMGHLRKPQQSINNNMSLSATSEQMEVLEMKTDKENNLVDDKGIDIDKIRNETAENVRARIKSIEAIKDDYKDMHPDVKSKVAETIDKLRFDTETTIESIKLEVSKIAIEAQNEIIKSMKDAKIDLNKKLEKIPDINDKENLQNQNEETVDPESDKIKNIVKGLNSVRIGD